MPELVPIRRALLSVSDKTDLVPFARALADQGVVLISTGGTAAALKAAGLEIIGIDEVTGFPEMMDGRVKTLHPAVHGALLARRDDPGHVEAMERHGIEPIDLVCVNLYPFERTLREELSRQEAIELIDIGGPSMIRSAAKNHEFVTIVTNPSQYDRVANEMRQHEGATTLALRRDLAAGAFSRTAEYDATISAWMCGSEMTAFPPMLRLSMTKRAQLRYGENPHQEAALYADPAQSGPNVVGAEILHGKPLSYNNLNDAAAAFELVRELAQVFPEDAGVAIIKHTNPCGSAVASDVADAFDLAHEGDPLAAYGGILALNRHVDKVTAERICEGQKFFEVVIAPSFDPESVETLGKRWPNVRVLATGDLDAPGSVLDVEYRSIPGGMLVQKRDAALADTARWQQVAGSAPVADVTAGAAFLWIICKHLKSNAVAIGAQRQLFGAGAGQVDRVTAARVAIEKAGGRIAEREDVIAASDGFFPFHDGPEALIDAGVKCIVQPGGSKRDADTVELCRNRGVTLFLTGVRHFKH